MHILRFHGVIILKAEIHIFITCPYPQGNGSKAPEWFYCPFSLFSTESMH